MTTATVLTGPERRRRWTAAEKLRLVEESLSAGLSVAEFARRRDIHPNLIHAWQREAHVELLRKLRNRSIAFNRCKSHFRLECRCVVPAWSSLHDLS